MESLKNKEALVRLPRYPVVPFHFCRPSSWTNYLFSEFDVPEVVLGPGDVSGKQDEQEPYCDRLQLCVHMLMCMCCVLEGDSGQVSNFR